MKGDVMKTINEWFLKKENVIKCNFEGQKIPKESNATACVRIVTPV